MRKNRTDERLFKSINMGLNDSRGSRKLARLLAEGWSVDSREAFLWKGTRYGTTYYLSRPNPDYVAKELA